MSEYKFVQWGKGIPVDYQRLGQMASNAQYLKDQIDPAPKGIVLWNQRSNVAFTATGAWQNVPNFATLTFDVGDDRLICVEFNSGVVTSGNIACNIRFGFNIDGNFISNVGGSSISATNLPSTSVSRYVIATPLVKGSHTITVQAVADTGATLTVGGQNSTASLTIRDEGQYISPTT